MHWFEKQNTYLDPFKDPTPLKTPTHTTAYRPYVAKMAERLGRLKPDLKIVGLSHSLKLFIFLAYQHKDEWQQIHAASRDCQHD